MNPLPHLAVATDFSAPARLAVDRAWLLAARHGSRLTLLHALGLDVLAPWRALLSERYAALGSSLHTEAQGQLDALVAEVAAASPPALPVDAQAVVQDGLAGWTVPDWVRAHVPDLLVVGARGSSGFKRWVLGSTASKLLRKSACPVLVVKSAEAKPYRRTVVAVDFSVASARSIEMARLLAPEADLVLLHAYEVPFEGKMAFAGVSQELIRQYRRDAHEQGVQRLAELAASVGLQPGDYVGFVVEGDPANLLLQHQELHRGDLIVMGKHGTHVTEELLLGSVTQRVIDETQVDLLVVVEPHGADVPSLEP